MSLNADQLKQVWDNARRFLDRYPTTMGEVRTIFTEVKAVWDKEFKGRRITSQATFPKFLAALDLALDASQTPSDHAASKEATP